MEIKWLISFLLTAQLFFSNISFAYDVSCKYDKKDCPVGYHCIHYEKDKDICTKNFSGDRLTLSYPFSKKTKFICDQGNLPEDGNSHTWNNTAYALDLQGDRSNEKNTIFAGVDGTVISFEKCKTKNDQCGLGFGNQIKILSEDNFIVFYAHLQEVTVKTGDKIKKGTPIGIEGETGWTGKNNGGVKFYV